jgi:adenosylcobinamide-GDP ribazoletransferase
MGRSTVFFPVVGLLIGLVLVVLNLLLGFILPPPLANVLLITALVLISGAMHLDGFADTCDGLAGHKPVEDRWEIMHDSRNGAFGITGIVLLLLVKYIALNSVPGSLKIMALLMVPVISRWAMTYAIIAFRYARPEGLGKAFNLGTSRRRFIIATGATLAIAVFAAWLAGITYYYLAGLAIIFVCWVIIVLAAYYLKKKFSGLTGDNYGAINEIAEVSGLIIINVLAYSGLFA